jgi:hypothetical protein
MDDPFTAGFDVGFDNATGFGFVDALAALDVALATKPPTKSPTKKPSKVPTKAPTKTPTKVPTKTPSKAPSTAPIKKKCGFFGFSIFCPFNGCGLLKRIFKINGCYLEETLVSNEIISARSYLREETYSKTIT